VIVSFRLVIQLSRLHSRNPGCNQQFDLLASKIWPLFCRNSAPASVHKAHFPHKPPPETMGEMAVVWWGGNFVEKKCYLRVVGVA